jgi:hypothetical protein
MISSRTWFALTAWAVAASWGCGGCESRAPAKPLNMPAKEEPAMTGIDVGPMEPTFLRLDHRLLELAGEVDVENRYLPAVLITVMSGEEAVMGCSGTAIGRQTVLTAGHCICPRRPMEPSAGGSRAIIDASACFKSAQVETVFYKPPVEEGARSSGSRGKNYRGKAHPHPALKVMLDEQGHVLSSQADLALVFLDEPLEFPSMPLATEAIREGDSVTIVGYGYDEVAGVFGWERRFCTNKVTRLSLAQDERVLIEQPGRQRYRQDSGGPCLRQEAKGPALAGISSRWLGEGAACTSIDGYRDWLRDEVRRVETSDPLHQ